MYSCPACKTQNHEHQKYCYKCGTWLQSSAFPAKRISNRSPRQKSGVFITIAIAVLALIGVLGWNNEVRIDSMAIGDQFTISQFIVKRPMFREPSAAADITALKEYKSPFEVRSVFYDAEGNRLGTASALVRNGMAANQITTINFDFADNPSLGNMSEVRVEVAPLSPLDLIERAADRIGKIAQ